LFKDVCMEFIFEIKICLLQNVGVKIKWMLTNRARS